MKELRAAVVGGGSIGARHLRNLRTLGVQSLALVEPDEERRRAVIGQVPVSAFVSLDDAFDWQPDAIVIATPSHLHVRQAARAVAAGCDVFIEKPLGHSFDGVRDLVAAAAQRNAITMVGCNMRFHPGPARVKALLDREVIGQIRCARIYTGSYLPEWRPATDYRASYSARSAMGGGVLLDCIHEIDLARWYLGDIEEVLCLAGRLALDIETEDYAALLCRHQGGAHSDIHLDYLDRSYDRGCHISGERGTIRWDVGSARVRWFDAGRRAWQEDAYPADWDTNEMYVSELRHFLACVAERRPTMFPVAEAAEVLSVALAARQAAQTGVLTPC